MSGLDPDHDRVGPPVDTLTAPHEPTVETRRMTATWSLLLAGPIVWITHFWVVYLVAESTCAAERSDGIEFLGTDGLTVVIIVATALAVGLCLGAAGLAWRRDASLASRVGAALSMGGALSILAVGLPILVLAPC